MKYLIVLVLLILLKTLGQFNKGDKLLGGYLSFGFQKVPESSISTSNSKVIHFSAQPKFGAFLNNKVALGGTTGYSFERNESTDPSGTQLNYYSRGFSIGLFFRKYYKVVNNFYISIDINPTFTKSQSEAPYSSKSESHSYKIKASPVFTYFPSKKIGLEVIIGSVILSHFKSNHSESVVNNLNLDYGSLNFGITYLFMKEE